MFPDLSEGKLTKISAHMMRSRHARRAAATRKRRYRTRFEDTAEGRRWAEALARVRSRGP